MRMCTHDIVYYNTYKYTRISVHICEEVLSPIYNENLHDKIVCFYCRILNDSHMLYKP